jgi:hypothetical protein
MLLVTPLNTNVTNPSPPINLGPPYFSSNSLVKRFNFIAGMSETYYLPMPIDPDNDSIKIDAILPSSSTSFIKFKDATFTFNPKEEDVLPRNGWYEIKLVLTDKSPYVPQSSEYVI